MESMDLRSTLQNISLSESIGHSVDIILPLAKEKEIQIDSDIKSDIIINVNPNLWSKVLSNILGNAVRYSPHSENVFISLQTKKSENILTIENTGVSIAEEELQNLFTPFYRADQSRNKATGGSGLGLYIVKTILDLHNFSYNIKNTKQGVIFTIILKAVG